MAEEGIEERMAAIEGAFTQLNHRLGRVEAELSEIRSEIRSLREEIHGEIRALHEEIRGLHGEIRALHGEIRGLHEEVHREIRTVYHRGFVFLTIWMVLVGTLIGVALVR